MYQTRWFYNLQAEIWITWFLLRSFCCTGALPRAEQDIEGRSFILVIRRSPGGPTSAYTSTVQREGGGESRFRRIRRHRAFNSQETMIIWSGWTALWIRIFGNDTLDSIMIRNYYWLLRAALKFCGENKLRTWSRISNADRAIMAEEISLLTSRKKASAIAHVCNFVIFKKYDIHEHTHTHTHIGIGN